MFARTARRVVCGVAVATGGLLLWAAPAGATFDTNTVGCAGRAVITPAGGGAPVTIDANQAKATVPKKADGVSYDGSVQTVTHGHVGSVELLLGPAGVEVYDWSSDNAGNQSSKAGTATYPKALENVPPGIYRLHGSHQGQEGGCSGHMDIEVAGSPASSPAGLGSAAGVLLSALGLLAAGRRKAGGRLRGHPILGGVMGLLLGFFAAVGSTFWKVAPLTTPLLAVALIAGLALGIAWAALGLLGGKGAAAGAAAV